MSDSRSYVHAAAVIIGAGLVGLAITWSLVGLLIGSAVGAWILFVAPLCWRLVRVAAVVAVGVFLYHRLPWFRTMIDRQVAADDAEAAAIKRAAHRGS